MLGCELVAGNTFTDVVNRLRIMPKPVSAPRRGD
jgi:hypothetical protein